MMETINISVKEARRLRSECVFCSAIQLFRSKDGSHWDGVEDCQRIVSGYVYCVGVWK